MRTSRISVGAATCLFLALLVTTPGLSLPVSSASTTIEQKPFFPICSQDVSTNCIEDVSAHGESLIPAHVLSNIELRSKDAKGRDSGILFGENRHPFWRCASGQTFGSPSGEACGVGDYPNFLLHAEDANVNFPVGPADGKGELDTEEGIAASKGDDASAYPSAYVGVQIFATSIFNHSENGFTTKIGSYGFHFDVYNRRGVNADVREDDEFTFRINFGFVPAPNFYANSDVVKYSTSVAADGATIVEMTLRPVVGASPPSQGKCDDRVGGQKTLYFNTGRFSWGSSAIDTDAKIERPFSGNAITTNGPCANGMPDIRPDGTLNVVLGAPHVYADGTLNTGEFRVILSPATMYAFGFSADRILSGGLSVTATDAKRAQKLNYQATITDDGTAVIKASGFHYSSPTLTLRRTPFKFPPLKTKMKISAPARAGRGRRIDVKVDGTPTNAIFFVRGSSGGAQYAGTSGGVVGQVRLSVTIPRSVPVGSGRLMVWFPGDRQSRNTSTEIPIRITP
ncbi:MAG: hypothetical protein RJB08_1678 [Actinomycetota bacterium]